jgi:ABC-2 type transport system ATP-binding protein
LAVRKIIGYLPENLPLYADMETAEYIEFVARARGLGGKTLRQRIAWVTERCGLTGMFRTPVSFLSKGYRQRLGLAQALVHDPEVIILDEPTSGLDPRQIREVRSLIRELSREKTVILSTHILQEAEAMADKIIVINRGKIAGQGTREELRRQTGLSGRVRFAVGVPPAFSEPPVRGLRGVKEYRLDRESSGTSRFILYGENEDEMVASAGVLAKDKGWLVLELAPAPFTLEESFLALTRSDETPPGSMAEPA